ncbi:unnamed protein product [Symbiodinium microadriaticum]|nr:unnamed protein product [Symbiodinium microadriaticum]
MTMELPHDFTIVDEGDLSRIAARCTKPRRAKAYQDDDEVKSAFRQAREAVNDRKLWKHAQKLRKQKRAQWQRDRYTAILGGDWAEYRALQRDRDRKRGWWGDLLRDRSSHKLTREVETHLVEKLTNPALSDWDDILQQHIELVRGGDEEFVPFSLLDVRTVLQDMKTSSAVGPDGISVSLLRHIASHDELGPQLLSLINHIVGNLALPAGWRDSFLALLAKVDRPTRPKDLRPICVSSSFHKMITKLVCTRVMPLLRSGSRISGCGKGRQAADVIGCLSRVRDVVQEWKMPMLLCKLDISGAFDRIDRLKLVEYLNSKLSHADVPCELRYMLAQMRTYKLIGQVPGGEKIMLEPNVGIKQGAPESAELFGMVMDHLLGELIGTKQWRNFGPHHPEMDLSLVFYQDDIFIIESDVVRLCRRVKVLERYLARAGLQLAAEKTKIIASPWVVGTRRARVGGDLFEVAAPSESVKVLGLAFNLYESPVQQARELMGRARAAAAKHQTLLRGKASWKQKVHMMETLVASQFKWTAGAVHWSREDLRSINVLQLHTMRNMFRMGRLGDESWVTWNTRTMRTCRAWLAAHHVPRWSTLILTLQHTLSGNNLSAIMLATDIVDQFMSIILNVSFRMLTARPGIYLPKIGTDGHQFVRLSLRNGMPNGAGIDSLRLRTSEVGLDLLILCLVIPSGLKGGGVLLLPRFRVMAAARGAWRLVLTGAVVSFLLDAMQEREDDYPGHLWEARWDEPAGTGSANSSSAWDDHSTEAAPEVAGGEVPCQTDRVSSYYDYTLYMASSWDAELCATLQAEEEHAVLHSPDPTEVPLSFLGVQPPQAAVTEDTLLPEQSVVEVSYSDPAKVVDWLELVGDARQLRGRRSVLATYVARDPAEIEALVVFGKYTGFLFVFYRFYEALVVFGKYTGFLFVYALALRYRELFQHVSLHGLFVLLGPFVLTAGVLQGGRDRWHHPDGSLVHRFRGGEFTDYETLTALAPVPEEVPADIARLPKPVSSTTGDEPTALTDHSTTAGEDAGLADTEAGLSSNSSCDIGFFKHGEWMPRARTESELRAHRGGQGEIRSKRKRERMQAYFPGQWKPAWLVNYARDKKKREVGTEAPESSQSFMTEESMEPSQPSTHVVPQSDWASWSSWSYWGSEGVGAGASSWSWSYQTWQQWEEEAEQFTSDDQWPWHPPDLGEGTPSSTTSTTLPEHGLGTWLGLLGNSLVNSAADLWGYHCFVDEFNVVGLLYLAEHFYDNVDQHYYDDEHCLACLLAVDEYLFDLERDKHVDDEHHHHLMGELLVDFELDMFIDDEHYHVDEFDMVYSSYRAVQLVEYFAVVLHLYFFFGEHQHLIALLDRMGAHLKLNYHNLGTCSACCPSE